jgi:hypothetical protein
MGVSWAQAVAHARGDDAQNIELRNAGPLPGQFIDFSRAMQTNTTVTDVRRVLSLGVL